MSLSADPSHEVEVTSVRAPPRGPRAQVPIRCEVHGLTARRIEDHEVRRPTVTDPLRDDPVRGIPAHKSDPASVRRVHRLTQGVTHVPSQAIHLTIDGHGPQVAAPVRPLVAVRGVGGENQGPAVRPPAHTTGSERQVGQNPLRCPWRLGDSDFERRSRGRIGGIDRRQGLTIPLEVHPVPRSTVEPLLVAALEVRSVHHLDLRRLRGHERRHHTPVRSRDDAESFRTQHVPRPGS